EAQYVAAVGLAPTVGRNHRNPGRQGEDGDALESAGRVAEEIHCDPVLPSSVLIKGIDNDRPTPQQVEDGVQRAPLGQRTKPSPPKSPGDEIIQQARLEGAAHEVKLAAVLRELADAPHGGDFEVAEMTRQNQQALALLMGADGRL